MSGSPVTASMAVNAPRFGTEPPIGVNCRVSNVLLSFNRNVCGPTNEGLHHEPGFWLSIPATTVLPVQPAATIARLGTIPHDDSMLAQGGGFGVQGGPLIGDVNALPSRGGMVLGRRYTIPFENPSLPQNFKLPFVQNPNLALKEAILGQNIISTVVLIISTNVVPTITIPTPANPNDPNPAGTVINVPAPSGGITNLPFVVQNANATRLDATFWIEAVMQPVNSTFMQLQYTQTVNLNFLGIDWPHISVATLVKQ